MKISAIIPTYNRADFIAEAIESVQNQTHSIDEIIIVDDGSNDTTCSILKKFDVKVIKTQNFGVSHARNLGIKEAKNDWVAFLDSDDLWMREKLKKQVKVLDGSDYKLCYTGGYLIDEDGNELGSFLPKYENGYIFKKMLFRYEINNQSVLIKKDVFRKFNENRTFRT